MSEGRFESDIDWVCAGRGLGQPFKRTRLARYIEERFLHFAASARFASEEKDWPLRSE
jgi:hypothetical protein